MRAWIGFIDLHPYLRWNQARAKINQPQNQKNWDDICGDDWQSDRNHRHHGIFLAVNEFIREEDFEFGHAESIASGSSDGDLKISLRFHFYARINFIRSMISSSRAPPRRAGRPLLVGPWRKGLHRPSEPALLLKTDIDPRLVSPLWVNPNMCSA